MRSPWAAVRGRGPRRALFALLVVPLLLLAGAGTASAHATLEGAGPVDGSVLKTSPKAVTLTFSESVGLLDNSIRVYDPGNRRVHTGRQEHADGRSDTASVTLPALAHGTYIVAWRVVSADSHPVSGALTFSVGKPSASRAVLPSDEAQDAASSALYDLARYVAYGGLALLLGVAVFTLATGVAAGAVRGLLVGGWWTLLAATLALVLLRGPYERGSGPAALTDLTVLRETAVSRPGLALLARVVLLGAAAVYARRTGPAGPGIPRRTPARIAVAVPLTLALALTWAVSEHAAAGLQVPLAMTSAVLHLLAMAVWLGGLAALLTVLYRAPEDLPAAAVTRFSRLALASVAVLVVTGVYQSWRGLGSFGALTSTTYGRLLTAKLVAVAVLLAAAAFSRRFTARLAAPDGAVMPDGAVSGGAVSGGAEGAGVTVAAPERVRETVGAASSSATTAAASATAESTVAVSARTDSGRTEDVPPDGEGAHTAPEGDHPPGAGGRAASEGGTPPDDPAPYRRALRRSVLAEITVGVVVLVITTLLTGSQPGRAATEEAAARTAADQPLGTATEVPFDVGTPGGHGKVQIELSPGRVGENQVQALVFGPDGGVATVPELRLSFTFEQRGIGPLDARLRNQGGYWGTDALNLPLPGVWTMRVSVRTSEIDQVTVSKKVRIG
ncbi:copper resistance protein CopC [Streptomyces sp. NPDC048664]|uniref:copper resistance CopC/CopD family protein n=1 Tax=Streptomyces sp. NPDC048664 TaxID=3154505 RepID=UPI003443CBCE